MAKTKIRKGSRLVCAPCGREVIINECGISERAIICCGRPMRKKARASVKKKK